MPLSPRAGTGVVAIGSEVKLISDAARAFQLANGHGGWATPMADCLGRSGVVVDVVNSHGDVRVNCGEYGCYVWNPATVAGPAYPKAADSLLALDLHPRRLFHSTDLTGSCGCCRRELDEIAAEWAQASNLEVELHPDATKSSAVSAVSVEVPPQQSKADDFSAYCSSDGAFRLCLDCAQPYLECPEIDPEDTTAVWDCPGKHGLSEVATHGNSKCDICSRKLDSGETLQACRTCDWGICTRCQLAASTKIPYIDIGRMCRHVVKDKACKAIVVDARGGPRPTEVLVHSPAKADGPDEWIKVGTQKLIPVEPPSSDLVFHPLHGGGLCKVRTPRGADKGPKCVAELKIPGGCRRFLASGSIVPTLSSASYGLYSERDDFFLCPHCATDEVLESLLTVSGLQTAYDSDVAALRDPGRASDAAVRIGRQCRRSVEAIAGLIQADLVAATAAATSTAAQAVAVAEARGDTETQDQQAHVLRLVLDLADWLFEKPACLQKGNRVLCEMEGGQWHVAVVQGEARPTCSVGGERAYDVVLAGKGQTVTRGLSHLKGTFINSEGLKLSRKTDGSQNIPPWREMLRKPAPRSGVPPPWSLSRDFLLKKAIPSDNTMQAKQYLIDGADLNTKSDNGDTVLLLTIEHCCSPKMAKMMLDAKCSMESSPNLGEPLQLAAKYGQVEVVELLLNARCDPHTLDLNALPQRVRHKSSQMAAAMSIYLQQPLPFEVDLESRKNALAEGVLRPLVSLVSRPTADLILSPQCESRFLAALDVLLGASKEAVTGCLQELTELVQRLMTAYSASAARGAVQILRRLLELGSWARSEMARCGVRKFVANLAESDQVDQTSRGIAVSSPVEPGSLRARELARELLQELDSMLSADESPATLAQPAAVVKFHALARSAIQAASSGATFDGAALVLSLQEVLLGSDGRKYVGGLAVTACELEQWGIPEALLELLQTGTVSASALVRAIGPETSQALLAALLRLTELNEALPVAQLPPYLMQASGLRVLTEPLVVAVRGEWADNAPAEVRPPSRPEELEKRWFQAEPLLRVQDFESALLATSPVLDQHFLSWCVLLVGRDVAPRDPVLRGRDAKFGTVTNFRLATPLKLPVHTVRLAKDDSLVDLVASVHGLAAVSPLPDQDIEMSCTPTELSMMLDMLQLEATSTPEDFQELLSSLPRVLNEKQARAVSPDSPWGLNPGDVVNLPVGAANLLAGLGFERAQDGSAIWHIPEEKLAQVQGDLNTFRDLLERRNQLGGGGEGDGPGSFEADPAIVSEFVKVFGGQVNAAKRACLAVKNSSLEDAIEWMCDHQGDPDINEPLPSRGAPGAADPKAPVWSVFIVLPPDVPFDLVWEMLEEPVKGALTSVANAWTAMGWAGGESEMRDTLRAQVAINREGPIARGLVREKAERVASRLRRSCECRVSADLEGAASAPRGRNTSGASVNLAPGARVHLVLEADRLGFVVAARADAADVVADDGRLLLDQPNESLRPARPAGAPLTTGSSASSSAARMGLSGVAALLAGASLQDINSNTPTPNTNGTIPSSVALPAGVPGLTSLQGRLQSLDRGAQESDVVRRFQPENLLLDPNDRRSSWDASQLPDLEDAPICRVAFCHGEPKGFGIEPESICLLRGERSAITVPLNSPLSFTSSSWVTVGTPGLAVRVGSWYWEMELRNFKNPQIGWADASFRFLIGSYSDDGVGDDPGSWGVDCDRTCLWHKGRAGPWRSASQGQTLCCAIDIASSGEAELWFGIDGHWGEEPVFKGARPESYVYPVASGIFDATLHFSASDIKFGPPKPHFRPLLQALTQIANPPQVHTPMLIPQNWTLLQGLYHLGKGRFPETPLPFVLQTKICVVPSDSTKDEDDLRAFHEYSSALEAREAKPHRLSLSKTEMNDGLPLQLTEEERWAALEANGIYSNAARAALSVISHLHTAVSELAPSIEEPCCTGGLLQKAGGPGTGTPTARQRVTPQGSVLASTGTLDELPGAGATTSASSSSSSSAPGVCSHRFGGKLADHLIRPLPGSAGALPQWCSELPILAPWLFPFEARENLLRYRAFGVTFSIHRLQELAVDDRFADRKRMAEEWLAQAKHIGDAMLMNQAYESLFELQGQIAKDTEVWVGSLKSELARVERENVLRQADTAMELTKSSFCTLEVQFHGESGFGRAVTQGFYTLVAHELQRRTANRKAPLWVEDDPPLSDEFLTPRRGLLVRPLPRDHPALPHVERHFCMIGRLMAKAIREGFVVPLPLTPAFFQLMLGQSVSPLLGLPRPGDGVAGEFVGACAQMMSDVENGVGSLEDLANDPEWSRRYMQAPGEEPVPPAPFSVYGDAACFLESGTGGAPLCLGGESRGVDLSNVQEFVSLASEFWLHSGVEPQMVAFRRGLYDVLGSGAVYLWAFSPHELRRLFCGEDEVIWNEKELDEHIHCGGGYTKTSEQVRWLREEMLDMPQANRAKFLEFVTSCPRLPPGGLRDLKVSVHPDPAESFGLPRSRACAHRLFLPRYASREELAVQLHEAIWSSGGHHEQNLPP